ncbi:MAG TPA: 2-C-methyl-D-erythritol 4-phosphate cytidylyltransferase [Candidatus Binatia bacterium]|nr:2-C-methyl-D-erythritol 4-phosphate cytidylyltransferase [Candidatus Binatia bacterium]
MNAIVVAAGEGRRMGAPIPKPFLPIGGRPIFLRALDHLAKSQTIERIILVAAARELPRCNQLLREDSNLNSCQWILQSGGVTRQASVRQGLEKIDSHCEVVVIHDGVRPFVSPALVDRCAEAARTRGAVVLGVPARDTIKIVSEDRWVQGTPAREALWEIQTPQAFRRDLIVEAHDRAAREGIEATDDAMLVEKMGHSVFVLEGARTNIKITVAEDLLFAEALLREGRVS